MTRTDDEVSIVCLDGAAPPSVKAERDWRGIKLHGPFAFDQFGILASFAVPLAENRIGIFAISTFDTDYVFVKQGNLSNAVSLLVTAGHTLAPSGA